MRFLTPLTEVERDVPMLASVTRLNDLVRRYPQPGDGWLTPPATAAGAPLVPNACIEASVGMSGVREGRRRTITLGSWASRAAGTLPRSGRLYRWLLRTYDGPLPILRHDGPRFDALTPLLDVLTGPHAGAPVQSVASSDQRNSVGEWLRWCHTSLECLSRPRVE